jgi:hypothetical protein
MVNHNFVFQKVRIEKREFTGKDLEIIMDIYKCTLKFTELAREKNLE